ncbi:hypothetical protein L873DRAFT_1219799 [Choiromyces venosus 120613-1]|uniref:Uncharacterized protein n=1 Tax=Choiromyces venosus 120613-1 TaxID=1336337 RepID=A0A3N4JIP2_9PEZI|nr:hypothetical protein L873DRAFT_1219799 [Choiromyces venosus 120613-1]
MTSPNPLETTPPKKKNHRYTNHRVPPHDLTNLCQASRNTRQPSFPSINPSNLPPTSPSFIDTHNQPHHLHLQKLTTTTNTDTPYLTKSTPPPPPKKKNNTTSHLPTPPPQKCQNVTLPPPPNPYIQS